MTDAEETMKTRIDARTPLDGRPYYCLTCSQAWLSYLSCKYPDDCKLEGADAAQRRRAEAFGTPSHKIIRRDASDTSIAAALSVDTTKKEREVYDLIAKSRSVGLTIKECARLMGVFPHTISGRFTGLKDKHLIRDSGKRRERSRVMIAGSIKSEVRS